MTRRLPDGAIKHKETKRFTAETIPAALTRNHDTKQGVWGLICMDAGELTLDFGDPVTETLHLAVGDTGVVNPEEVHKVTLQHDAEFHIEFYSLPKTNT